ncbi:hypothetical protein FG379_000838 [Cryptosporidium bovis]|uniref:uncharacterized protein n=1 Tax=Cryptosporidium bovis TaxID=310047 RepID=UPI00351A6B1A|nr:hypothetical protein FG379_000838 [Cryptosporidium bovis]
MNNMEYVNQLKHEVQEDDQVIFVKLLVSDSVADRILGNSASIIKKIKQVNHVFILVSGTDKYFPGTNYRVATMEGNEKNVNETLEALSFMLKNENQTPNNDIEIPRNNKYILRLAVPRSVIGSVIGIKGEFIRHVRMTTNAHINISPIFVTSEKACNERIVTISANSSNQVIHAFIILSKKVNSTPEGKSCKGIIYRRNDIFKRGKNNFNDGNDNNKLNKIDPLLNSQLEEIKNAFNKSKSINGVQNTKKEDSIADKPKLNYKIIEGGRWSEHLSLLNYEENDDIIIREGQKAKEYNSQNKAKLYDKQINRNVAHKKISTNIFVVSLIALIIGIFFFQYISKEVVYI